MLSPTFSLLYTCDEKWAPEEKGIALAGCSEEGDKVLFSFVPHCGADPDGKGSFLGVSKGDLGGRGQGGGDFDQKRIGSWVRELVTALFVEKGGIAVVPGELDFEGVVLG